jgi:hypothetical protein
MANFVKWRGPALKSGAPGINKVTQKTEVGQAFKFGIWGGSGLNIGPNDRSVAQINQRDVVEDATNNITWYELVGLREGDCMIEARNPADGRVWDYFQLDVSKRTSATRPRVHGVGYDYQADTKGIGPNWNASMILTLKIALVPASGTGSPPQIADSNGTVFATKPWTDAVWNGWAAKFKKLIERNFSEKMWLAGPAALTELVVTDKGTSYRVNLHCVLRVELTGFAAAHHRVPVVLATQTLPPGPVVVNSNSVTFRSNSTQLDNKDIQTDTGLFGSLTSTAFNTATHEVGHLLGLHHPFEGNPAAALPGNNVYCVVGNADCNAVMGMGNQLRTSYAAPWQQAAASWFNSAGKGYNLKASDFSPSLFRLAPTAV